MNKVIEYQKMNCLDKKCHGELKPQGHNPRKFICDLCLREYDRDNFGYLKKMKKGGKNHVDFR
jgi:hypothetical protein